MNCPGCLKDNEEGYCLKCRKELFDTSKKISSVLPFKSPYKEESEVFRDHTKKISISGVQVKYSLKLEGNALTLTEKGGQYILKPIPVGTFKNLDSAPANEHLTMQIARQVYNISVPPNALIFFTDKSPAYLVRRFDRHPEGGKFQQEDFAQLAQITADIHGENYKYDLSYEEIAELIKKYIPSHQIELEKFFRLILMNYLISNGDAHLKNFSVIQSTYRDYVLTPAYDLLCTRIHAPGESDMALTLYKDGFPESFEAYGFHTYQDFYRFGQQIGIKATRVKKIMTPLITPQKATYDLIDRSFLNEDIKKMYKDYYDDKIKRLNMGLE